MEPVDNDGFFDELNKRHGNKSKLNEGLVADLEDVKRLIDIDILTTACSCYSDKTNGSMSAFFALDKVRLRVEKIINKISN